MSHGETPFPSSGLVMDAPMTITYFNFWGQPQKTDQGFDDIIYVRTGKCRLKQKTIGKP